MSKKEILKILFVMMSALYHESISNLGEEVKEFGDYEKKG